MIESIAALMGKGEWGEAQSQSEKLVFERPTYAEAYAYLGICHFHHQRFEQALGCFQKATTLNPKYWEAGLKSAQCLDRLARFEEAYEMAKTWHAVNPNDRQLNFMVQTLKRYESTKETDGWQRSKYKPDHHVTMTNQ